MEPQPNAAPTEGAVVTAQPTGEAQQPAAQPTEPTQGQPVAQADETAAWLQSKGIDPTDPASVQKIAEMARNSEKQMTKATQEASELKRSLTPAAQQPQAGADPAMGEFIQDYRRDKLITGFKEAHPDWREHESAMASILNQVTPSGYTNSQLVNAGLMSLDMVYATAKGTAPVNTEQIKTQAQQEVLQTLANTQRAGGGNAQASNTNPQPTEDPVIAAIRASRGK